MKKASAEQKIIAALAKLEAWKEPQENSIPDWQSVGEALLLAHQAIDTSPQYYKGWILLADIYFQIGKIYLDQKSLDKAYTLINIRPNFPGAYYERIEKKIKKNKAGIEMFIPDWFVEKYKTYFYEKN